MIDHKNGWSSFRRCFRNLSFVYQLLNVHRINKRWRSLEVRFMDPSSSSALDDVWTIKPISSGASSIVIESESLLTKDTLYIDWRSAFTALLFWINEVLMEVEVVKWIHRWAFRQWIFLATLTFNNTLCKQYSVVVVDQQRSQSTVRDPEQSQIWQSGKVGHHHFNNNDHLKRAINRDTIRKDSPIFHPRHDSKFNKCQRRSFMT